MLFRNLSPRDINPFLRIITPVYHWKKILSSKTPGEFIKSVSLHNSYWMCYLSNLINKSLERKD